MTAATMDGFGTLTLPPAIRERLGLHGGTKLEVARDRGAIELRPVPPAPYNPAP